MNSRERDRLFADMQVNSGILGLPLLELLSFLRARGGLAS